MATQAQAKKFIAMIAPITKNLCKSQKMDITIRYNCAGVLRICVWDKQIYGGSERTVRF